MSTVVRPVVRNSSNMVLLWLRLRSAISRIQSIPWFAAYIARSAFCSARFVVEPLAIELLLPLTGVAGIRLLVGGIGLQRRLADLSGRDFCLVTDSPVRGSSASHI